MVVNLSQETWCWKRFELWNRSGNSNDPTSNVAVCYIVPIDEVDHHEGWGSRDG